MKMFRCAAEAPDGSRCEREAEHTSLHYAEVADGVWEWGDLPDDASFHDWRTKAIKAPKPEPLP